MGWFKRKGEPNAFDGLSPKQLAALAVAYRKFATQALLGKEPLIISPGSPETVQFLKDLAAHCEALEREGVRSESVGEVAKAAQDGVHRFGEWQREQARLVIEGFAESLSGLASCCSGSFESQDAMLDSLKGIGTRLETVRESDDIAKIREALTKEAEKMRRVVRHHLQSHEALREQFGAQVREMEARIARAEESAQTDHVTHLGNRVALEFFVESAMQRMRFEGGPFCISLFDLDDFKGINDRYGHSAGDEVLNQFATKLREAFPQPAFVGRFGGDEFVTVAAGDAALVGRRAHAAVAQFGKKPIEIHSEDKTISVRVGASGGTTELRLDELLSQSLTRADHALYVAKGNGKGRALAA